MGLLDSLFSGGGSSGGLLDFLRNNAMNQQFSNGGAPGDQAQYGQSPMPMQANAQTIPQQPPSVIQAGAMPPVQSMPQGAPQTPQMAPQQQPDMSANLLSGAQGVGNHLLAGAQGLANSGGVLPGLVNGLSGLLTGQRTDPQGMALQQQQQQRTALFQALRAQGIDPQTAMAAALNPEVGTKLLEQKLGPDTVQSLGEGHIYHSKTGKVEQAYEPSDSHSVVKIGQNGLGVEQYGILSKSDGSITPIKTPGDASGGGLGDQNLSGDAYLKSLPKAQAGIVQGMIDGTIQPPSSFALAKPYWQGMLAAAKNADPSFDANTWTTRHKMSSDMAASGNSSMGGILANGKSAFAHLSDLSGSMSDLGNASHDYPGGGAAATVQNYLGNKTFAGSDTLAKIKAINDNLGHYGQESTKFYSGTGGGVEERMNALKEMNPTTTSSEEMASYLAKEKSLMTDRLKQKEAQIKDTMGDAYLAKHPIFTPDLQQTLDTIDGNIAKLKAGTAPATTATPRALPKVGDMQGGYRFKGGNPADKANWEPVS